MAKLKVNPKINLKVNSIKAKLIMLGAVSIICAIILGVTGIYIMNSNNSNNQILNDINSISVMQSENIAEEATFLRDLDTKHYKTINNNLDEMDKVIDDARKISGLRYSSNLKKMSSGIHTSKENNLGLSKLLKKRGFASDQGLYKSFFKYDEKITANLKDYASEASWIDGTWDYVELSTAKSTKVKGEKYKKYKYENKLSAPTRRDLLVLRIGGYGIDYTGNVYISDIKLDDKKVDINEVKDYTISYSYGDGLSNMQMVKVDNKDCFNFDTKFIREDDSWKELVIYINVTKFDTAALKKVSYNIYFEDTQNSNISISANLDGVYEFATSLEQVNSMVDEYSTLVAEGKDVGSYTDDINKILSEMITCAPIYTLKTDIVDSLVGALNKKVKAFEKIVNCDKDIIKAKTENNKISSNLNKSVSAIRKNIEKKANTQKAVISSVIYIVFIIGVALVVILTIFVILSVQKSIMKFKGTLERISDGEINIKAEVNNKNEFDTFGRSLNRMTDKFSDVIGDVVTCGKELNKTGSELEEMSHNCEDISEKLDSSILGIAQGASSQAEDVENSTNEILHLNDLMGKMDEDIMKLDETSVSMQEASDGAVTILNQLSNSNVHMTNGIKKIAEQIGKTNSSVTKIEEAVSLISSIASQTNLLALNASIEAARAGEAGRGFAVVASEIQQLADQSNSSSNTIFEVISKLINDFKETLEVMEEVERATEEQNDKLIQTQKQFEIVNSGIEQLRNKTAVIKKAIDECTKVQYSVSRIMTNLSVISEEYAATTTDTASAVQHLNNTISGLAKESQNLMKLSSEIEENIRFFKFEM